MTPYWTTRRKTRRATAAADLLAAMSALENAGCRVIDAHLLPMPRIRVDGRPDGIDTWGHLEPPVKTIPAPTEHYTRVGSVLVTWYALAGGRRHA